MSNRLLVFFTYSHGIGGHCHSITNYYDEFIKEKETYLLNIGLNESPLNKERGGFFIKASPFNFLSVICKLHDLAKAKDINEILCIDKQSYAYMRVVSLITKSKIVLVKPGGPNPKRFFPKANTLVNFSHEGDDFFRNKGKFAKTNLFVIPNRVKSAIKKRDSHDLNIIREKYDNVILRISRIGNDYYKSLVITIKEFEKYNVRNKSSSLVIVGVVENDIVFNKLKETCGENVYFFTDKYHSTNSKDFIHYADVYIGCGRSAMEALANNVQVAIPSVKTGEVVMFDEITASRIAYMNFSPRVDICNKNLSSFELNHGTTFSLDYFEKNININKVNELYYKVFKHSKHENLNNILDIIYGLIIHITQMCIYKIKEK